MDIRLISCFHIFVLYFFAVNRAHSLDYCVDEGYTPDNGSRNPIADYQNYFPGSVIRYQCNDKYKLTPDEPVQTCVLNNQGHALWMPQQPPTCVEVATCAKPAVKNANFSKDIFYEGENLYLYISCDSGYTLIQGNKSVCLMSGEWSYLPSCVEMNCTDPPMIQHGYYKFYLYRETFSLQHSSGNEWPPGTSVFYQCKAGYLLEPSSQSKRVCTNGVWSGVDPVCVREGCDPPDTMHGRYVPMLDHYEVHNTISYMCIGIFDEAPTRTCKADHTWSGTPCSSALTTKQMPYTSNHNNVYCSSPSPLMHGSFQCCSKEQMAKAGASDESRYCCPVRGVVEFVCNPGYVMAKGEVTQWICGTAGEWVSVDSGNIGTPSAPPTCYSNTTRPDPDQMPDEILRPVIITAVGVLLILSVAVIIAFCRPKIKDMKRRWRKLREEDDEIIIDGRRILLPSYEEAVTSNNPYLQFTDQQILTDTNYADNGPSTSYGYDNVNNSRDDAAMIFQVHIESPEEHARNFSSSDEEMLVPETKDNQNEGPSELNNGISQSMTLKAVTSVNACVLINQSSKNDVTSRNKTLQCTTSGENHAFESSNVLTEGHDPLLNFSLNKIDTSPFLRNDNICFMDTENESDTNLDSICPKTLMTPVNIKTPINRNEGLDLLSYPIMPVETDECRESQERESFTINIEPTNLSDPDPVKIDVTAVKSEESSNSLEDESNEPNQSQPIITNSDPIHIVMSSHTPSNREQQLEDETGSTSV